MTPRSRWSYGVALLAVLLLGLASRKIANFPIAFGKYPGDALWGLMVYLIIRLLLPRMQVARSAQAAASFGLMVELFKLVQAPALVHLRSTTAGGLLLGHRFSLANLLAYAVGICIGALIDGFALKGRPAPAAC